MFQFDIQGALAHKLLFDGLTLIDNNTVNDLNYLSAVPSVGFELVNHDLKHIFFFVFFELLVVVDALYDSFVAGLSIRDS